MNIAVFCASSDNVGSEYRQLAHSLGEWIGRKGHVLVYGGATGGLMDEVAGGAHSENTEIVGIIPQSVIDRGRMSDLPTELLKVSDLGERKAMLKEYADVFVALPGGFGTLDEMMDAISARKLAETDARTIIVNVNGFYDGLEMLIGRFNADGLGKPVDAECYSIVYSFDELIEELSR